MNHLTCDTAHEWIVRDLDEGLETDESTALGFHLLECPHCRRFKEEVTSLLSLIPEDAAPEPDEEFWIRYRSSLNARLQEKAGTRKLPWRFGWKAAAMGALAAVAVFTIVMEGPFRNPPTEQWHKTAQLPELMQEFKEMYGPLPEEVPKVSTSSDSPLIKVDSRVQLAGPDLMSWYDMDDETNGIAF
jgi:hypothetical protein